MKTSNIDLFFFYHRIRYRMKGVLTNLRESKYLKRSFVPFIAFQFLISFTKSSTVMFDAAFSFILIYDKVKQYESISFNMYLFIPPPSNNVRSSSHLAMFYENCGLKILRNSQRKYQYRSQFTDSCRY